MEQIKYILLRKVVQVATYLDVPSDKLLHFICSAVIMIILMPIFGKCMATIATIGICIGKEIYDCHKKHPSGWSWGDLLADLLGILIII